MHFDGKMFKAGLDYKLDIPFNSKLFADSLGPETPLKDFIYKVLENSEHGYSTETQEELGKVFLMSFGLGLTPMPFIYLLNDPKTEAPEIPG